MLATHQEGGLAARRSPFHNIGAPAPTTSDEMPSQAAREEFGRRLQKAMIQKGWGQAELARRATDYMPTDERTRRPRKIWRDAVSRYIRGKNFPEPVTLAAMAKALGKDSEELLPSRGVPRVGEDNPAFDMRDLKDGRVWLRINQAVPWDKALEIAKLLRSEEK